MPAWLGYRRRARIGRWNSKVDVRNIFQKEKAALTFRSHLFVFFRHKNRFSATLFIPCISLGGKVIKYGAKLKGLRQSYIVSKTVIR